MGSARIFDYDQPTRDSLAGIYVEVSDERLGQMGDADFAPARQSVPEPAALYGLILTADDSANGSHGR